MKALLLGYSLLSLLVTTATAEPLLRPNDRVAICGDQVTANLGYSICVEDYLLMCQPVKGLDVAQFGWGGQTAAAFLARLDTDLLPYKPTVVMTCFGMNDGGFKALNDEVATSYRKAQTTMVEAFKKNGVRTIVLGSPRAVNPLVYRGGPDQAAIYNKTLKALAEIDKNIASKEGIVYADVFGATVSAMEAAKARYGKDHVFDKDPGERWCSLVVASAFLRALGCDGNIGTITVDYKAGTAACDSDQTIRSYKNKTLKMESKRYAFSFFEPPTLPALKCSPFNEDLNRYKLVIKNVPSARVRVAWNRDEWCDYRAHESRNFSAAEVARGINLSAEFADIPDGHIPFCFPFGDVTGAVIDQQQQEQISGMALVANRQRDAKADALRDQHFKTALKRFVPYPLTLKFRALAPEEKRAAGPINVIVDTDMSGDCDDAGAVALLNSFMVQGEANLIACVIDNGDTDLSAGATVQAINAYYGHPSIPIGANHGRMWLGGPTKSHYTLKVHQRFNPSFPTDDKLPAGVTIYRKALASAPDGTVAIASIGLMENLLDLIKSKPDEVSNLSGLDLVRKKVRELVIMSNTSRFDNAVLDVWPTKITFTFCVGSYISTGKSLINTPEDNPVRFICPSSRTCRGSPRS